MQKDVHYYLTFALARAAGIGRESAAQIAWANQFTDELTAADLYGIQTQSAVLGNWKDKQIQASVLVPFHFLPGDDKEHPWVVTRNSRRARKLVELAGTDRIRLGLALHALQDTFSHESFTGWEEKANDCGSWHYIFGAFCPNVGHADVKHFPDIVSYVWTDPRTGRRIDNRRRALTCAKVTYEFLCRVGPGPLEITQRPWLRLMPALKAAFREKDYQQRKQLILAVGYGLYLRYAESTKDYQQRFGKDFIIAARAHLAAVLELCADLPVRRA